MDPSINALAQVIALVESANHPYALRFEPAVFAYITQEIHDNITDNHLSQIVASREAVSHEFLIEHIASANICTHPTAEVIYSSSFGLYQIMGLALYSQGYDNSIGYYLGSRLEQDASFARYLNARKLPTSWPALKASIGDLEHFALRYNGNVAYAKRMVAAAMTLGL
jgi:hypothetical protein